MAITAQGMKQPDIDIFLRAIATLNNELRADRILCVKTIRDLLVQLDTDAVGYTDYEAKFYLAGSVAPWPANVSAAALVVSGFTSIDMSQAQLDAYVATVETLVNELRADRATMAASYDGILAYLDADGMTDSNYDAVLAVGGTGDAWPADPTSTAIDDVLITTQGISQPDLYDLFVAIQALSNELRTDRASQSASFDALCSKLDGDGAVGLSTDYEAVLAVGGSGNAWPANPASAALDLTA